MKKKSFLTELSPEQAKEAYNNVKTDVTLSLFEVEELFAAMGCYQEQQKQRKDNPKYQRAYSNEYFDMLNKLNGKMGDIRHKLKFETESLIYDNNLVRFVVNSEPNLLIDEQQDGTWLAFDKNKPETKYPGNTANEALKNLKSNPREGWDEAFKGNPDIVIPGFE